MRIEIITKADDKKRVRRLPSSSLLFSALQALASTTSREHLSLKQEIHEILITSRSKTMEVP
jgi:hypothetical protein